MLSQLRFQQYTAPTGNTSNSPLLPSGVPQVSDVGMISVARSCSVILTVSADGCPGITDATVAAFAKYSVDLAGLSVKNCVTLTDTAFKVGMAPAGNGLVAVGAVLQSCLL